MKRIFALFLVIAATGILLAKVTVPSLAGRDGDGSKFSTRTYPLSDFTDLDVSNAVKVIYTQGDSYKVQLTGRTDWLDLMEVTSKGGTLKVQAKSSSKFNNVKKKDQPDGEHNFILACRISSSVAYPNSRAIASTPTDSACASAGCRRWR